jgi:hypothetical protein
VPNKNYLSNQSLILFLPLSTKNPKNIKAITITNKYQIYLNGGIARKMNDTTNISVVTQNIGVVKTYSGPYCENNKIITYLFG